MIRTTAKVTFFLVMLTARAEVCHAQDYAAAVGGVPESLRALKFDASFADVQKAIPSAKPFGSATDPRSGLFLYFTLPEVWDAAALDFVNGRLDVINFMIIQKTPDVLPRSLALLNGVLDRNGAAATRLITLSSAKEPIPTRVWMKDDFQLFAIGPAPGLTVAGKAVLRVDPQLRIGVARKAKAISALAEVPTPDEMRELLFKAVSPVEKE